MTESELNARYTVVFVNSLHIDDCGCYMVSKADADRLTKSRNGKADSGVKTKAVHYEVFGLVNGELIGKKLEVV